MLSNSLARLMVQEFRGPVAESEDGSGTGGALFTSGNEYDGAFYQNKLHGKGTYKWQDGTTYEGEFGNNKMTGYGKYTWIQGSIYTGEFKDGKKHGQGTFVLQMDSEGNRYEGGWKEGKPCGHGHLIYQNGASYTGEFENGLRHGKGRLVYASGNVYDGEWKDNVKHGHGKMTWTTKGEEYDGNWFEGKPDGMGTYIWRLNAIRDHQYPLLNIYRGTFVEGMRHGFGVFQYANGARYEGEWFQNLKHGKAKFSTDNGRQYIGTFDNDRPTIPFSRFENSVPYVFRVPQEQGHTVEGVLSDLNNIIFRHVIELRKIYHYYCHLAQRHSDEPRNVITRDIVWKLFKEIGITKQVTLVDVDRACAILYKGDLIAEHRYHEPHVPSTEFILHDFIEILVLTSHHLYKNCKERSIHQVGIAASFAYMIKTDLLPHSHGLHQEDETLTEDEKVVKSLYNDFYLLYGEKMSNLYHDLAKKQPHALSQSRKDFTMTVRQVLLTLKEYKILDQYKTLSISRVIESFAKIYPFIHDGDSYNLEFEVFCFIGACIHGCL
ncbi:hypothetical protein EDD86DRAFT_188847 [Gorgonomyces haynaldii]|nr:hypothetical protein EDD86DRAFT_188847 [Gorgonomyces haynaldii]